MSSRIARLIHLHQLKIAETGDLYRKLIHAQEEFKNNKVRHEQLLGYRQDYVLQLEQLGNEGSAVGRLRNRIDFISHLDHALVQLNTHLAQLAKARAKADLLFREAKIAEEALKKLIEQVKKAEELTQQRKDQKESDEYAQKQWYSKNIK